MRGGRNQTHVRGTHGLVEKRSFERGGNGGDNKTGRHPKGSNRERTTNNAGEAKIETKQGQSGKQLKKNKGVKRKKRVDHCRRIEHEAVRIKQEKYNGEGP